MTVTTLRRSARALAACVGLALTCAGPAARADTEAMLHAAEEDRERALSIGKNAIELFQQGSYRLALERFHSAERARHSPVFVLYIARSHARLGELLEAKRHYERVVAEPLTAESPAPWISARDDAGLELRALEPRIPSIELQVTGQPPVELLLDGRAVPARDAEVVWLDPGEHELVAKDARGGVTRRRFSVVEGERAKLVELPGEPFGGELPASPVSGVPSAPERASSSRAPAGPAPGNASRSGGNSGESRILDPLGVTLLSAGTLGVVVGAVTGLLSLSRTRAIEENCEGSSCLAEDADDGAAARRLAVASNVAFVVGGAAFASFAVRAWVLPAAPAPSAPRRARLSFGVSGRF